jgi:hypothetical protein
LNGEKNVKCPECGNNTIPFVKAWMAGPLFRFNCPGCHMKLKVHKASISRFSSIFIGVLIGALISLWILNICRNPAVFVPAAALLVALDILIDRKFIVLKKRPA